MTMKGAFADEEREAYKPRVKAFFNRVSVVTSVSNSQTPTEYSCKPLKDD